MSDTLTPQKKVFLCIDKRYFKSLPTQPVIEYNYIKKSKSAVPLMGMAFF